MDQPVLSPIKIFKKYFQVAKKKLSMEIYVESLKGQYASICGLY